MLTGYVADAAASSIGGGYVTAEYGRNPIAAMDPASGRQWVLLDIIVYDKPRDIPIDAYAFPSDGGHESRLIGLLATPTGLAVHPGSRPALGAAFTDSVDAALSAPSVLSRVLEGTTPTNEAARSIETGSRPARRFLTELYAEPDPTIRAVALSLWQSGAGLDDPTAVLALARTATG